MDTRRKRARLALAYAFEVLRLAEIVSFTTVANRRSRQVMQRLGMCHDARGDFDQTALPGHRLQSHELHQRSREDCPSAASVR